MTSNTVKRTGAWRLGLGLLVSGLAACQGGLESRSQQANGPFPQAHAHNDYEHPRPLLDALDHGFMSVEADVFTSPLLGLDLYVAHDPQDIRPERTLRNLYLEPLRERVQSLGAVQPGQQQAFQLLIDFKTEAESTWQVLDEQLQEYADILSRYQDGEVVAGLVTVVISGNRPRDTLASMPSRLAFMDGRLGDLDNPPPPQLVPLISDNWNSHFNWRGDGTMPSQEQDKLASIMNAATSYGYRIRFWATPDAAGPQREAIWLRLWESGVHHINTDDLAGLEQFLRAREAES